MSFLIVMQIQFSSKKDYRGKVLIVLKKTFVFYLTQKLKITSYLILRG